MTTMNDSMMPIQGATVVSSDREELGKVKEIMGDCFKIDAPMAPDYWLASDSIATMDAGKIILRFRRSDVNEIKMGMPGSHSGIHRHAA